MAASARASRGDLIEGCCTFGVPVLTGGKFVDLILPFMMDLSVVASWSRVGSAELGAGFSSEDRSAIASLWEMTRAVKKAVDPWTPPIGLIIA